MATKTISLTDEAYERLRRLKRGRESFSEVVLRLTGRADLMRFAGSISPDFADELEHHSRSFRVRFDRDAHERLD